MAWCFQPMPAVELAQHCLSMGVKAIEGVGVGDYAALRELGMDISLVSSHGFRQGMADRGYHPHNARESCAIESSWPLSMATAA